MKKINKKAIILLLSSFLLIDSGCKKSYLDSELLSSFSPDNLNTVDAMKVALNGIGLQTRREYFGDSAPMLTESIFSEVAVEGTTDKSTPAQDLVTRITPDANLNSDDFNKIGWYWDNEFLGVRYANTIISNIDLPKNYASVAEKNAILGAAYFYRAYFYYRIVHQFGDVPLLLKDLDAPRSDFFSTKREVILGRMKTDLEFAQQWVTDNGLKGEVTKGAVQHLLTKVNLSLGKFDDAIASATAVIGGGKYAMMTSRFGSTASDATKNVVWDLHRMDNKALATNREALLLVIDRETIQGFTPNGSQLMRNTVPAWHFANVKTPSGATALTDAVTAEFPLTRMYGRGIGRYRGTPYSTKYIWNDNTDYRHAKGMWMDMTDLVYNNPALKNSTNQADRDLYGKPLVPYTSANVAQRFQNGALDTIRHWFGWPHYKVFINSTNALANDPYWTPPRGTNTDWYVFRLAETYLLRAEAHYWKGDLGLAMADLNVVRARANAQLLTDPTKVNIGTILDERARELYWEEPRKTELTRIAYIFATTGKQAYNGKTYSLNNFSDQNFFYDRIMEKNDFYKNNVITLQGVKFTIAPYHVLWPIPAYVQRFNTQGVINQNKGYTGYENNVPALDKIP